MCDSAGSYGMTRLVIFPQPQNKANTFISQIYSKLCTSSCFSYSDWYVFWMTQQNPESENPKEAQKDFHPKKPSLFHDRFASGNDMSRNIFTFFSARGTPAFAMGPPIKPCLKDLWRLTGRWNDLSAIFTVASCTWALLSCELTSRWVPESLGPDDFDESCRVFSWCTTVAFTAATLTAIDVIGAIKIAEQDSDLEDLNAQIDSSLMCCVYLLLGSFYGIMSWTGLAFVHVDMLAYGGPRPRFYLALYAMVLLCSIAHGGWWPPTCADECDRASDGINEQAKAVESTDAIIAAKTYSCHCWLVHGIIGVSIIVHHTAHSYLHICIFLGCSCDRSFRTLVVD